MKSNSKKTKSISNELISAKNVEILSPKKFDALRNKGSKIVIGTLNVFASPVNPGKNAPHLTSGKKRQTFDLLVFLTILALGAIGLFFWFIFSPKVAPIEISISYWPKELVVGQEANFKIDYVNYSDDILRSSNLALNLPEYFDLNSINVENFDLQNNTIYLGDLNPGAKGEIEFSGVFWGETNVEYTLKTVFSCQNGNDKTLYKMEQIDFKAQKSLLDLQVEIPEKVYLQSAFETKIVCTNNSQFEIEKAYLKINYPESFVSKDQGEIIWVKNLLAGESKEIVLSGYLDEAGENEDIWRDFVINFGLVKNGDKLNQSSFAKNMKVDFAKLNLATTSEIESASLGDTLNLNLNYKNNEDVNIENLKIWFETDSSLVNFTNNQIDIIKIEAGQEGSLDQEVTLINSSDYQLGENLVLEITSKAVYNLVGQTTQITAIGQKIAIPINSNLKLTAQARYFTDYGDQLGVGPLPLVVGEETRYWISIKITNTTNVVDDLQLKVNLAPNVRWTGKTNVSIGDSIEYNNFSNQAVWKNSKIGTYAGVLTPAYQIGFELGITPSDNQVGEILSLIEKVELTGIDNFTKKKLSLVSGSINTALINDKLISPEMYVVEAY